MGCGPCSTLKGRWWSYRGQVRLFQLLQAAHVAGEHRLRSRPCQLCFYCQYLPRGSGESLGHLVHDSPVTREVMVQTTEQVLTVSSAVGGEDAELITLLQPPVRSTRLGDKPEPPQTGRPAVRTELELTHFCEGSGGGSRHSCSPRPRLQSFCSTLLLQATPPAPTNSPRLPSRFSSRQVSVSPTLCHTILDLASKYPLFPAAALLHLLNQIWSVSPPLPNKSTS